ncbi:MAG: hypothetical protein ACXWP5_10360 [Bdellovibrionota bacterium]
MKKVILSSKVTLIALTLLGSLSASAADAPEAPLDLNFDVIDKVVNLGSKALKFVEDNHPVATVEMGTSSALPPDAGRWENTEGWKQGWTQVLNVSVRNAFHGQMVHLAFRVHYDYDGMVGGKGHYLTNVRVVPEEVSVAWDYKVNASATVAKVTNVGTRENPVASMELSIQWTIDSPLKHSQGAQTLVIQGDGEVQIVN